jgi:hypothetical protein
VSVFTRQPFIPFITLALPLMQRCIRMVCKTRLLWYVIGFQCCKRWGVFFSRPTWKITAGHVYFWFVTRDRGERGIQDFREKNVLCFRLPCYSLGVKHTHTQTFLKQQGKQWNAFDIGSRYIHMHNVQWCSKTCTFRSLWMTCFWWQYWTADTIWREKCARQTAQKVEADNFEQEISC